MIPEDFRNAKLVDDGSLSATASSYSSSARQALGNEMPSYEEKGTRKERNVTAAGERIGEEKTDPLLTLIQRLSD